MLDRNGVSRAIVTGTPPGHVRTLYNHAPVHIVPFLGAYRQPEEKETWHRDTTLPARIAAQLASGPWRGIGELHLFASERHSPVFRRLAKLAEQHDVPLLLHGDPAVIDSLYEHTPGVIVIWAHGGAYPWPPLIRDYLERYPGLYVDLSVREEPAVWDEIAAVAARLREIHAGRQPSEIDGLRPARELYRAFGMDFTRHRPSSEALLRRVLQGVAQGDHAAHAVPLGLEFGLIALSLAVAGAGIWLAGAIGVACGAGFYAIAAIGAVMSVLIVILLRAVERRARDPRWRRDR